ncbi:MAG: manganese-dependent inorganic pyrophosphatase [Veillonella sp.]|nr:manganese-dependent inorganic pyrophosphatase [Veillonella sp.]MCF0155840.1 manganese-dependent inorganic pyrophosphatase [Veillonella sp.]
MSKIFVTGHKSPDTDSICSAISYANLKKQLGFDAQAICAGPANKETQFALKYFGFEQPQIVTNFSEVVKEGDSVILVDHNESKQIIDGHENVEIVEVVDHHRFGDFETAAPIMIRVEPVGCTATIVTKLYEEKGQDIPKEIAGLLMSAIISDTVLFRSPTCTDEDKAALEKLANIAGVNYEEYGMEMLKAGADISDLSNEDIVRTDMKEFSEAGQTITIAQISVMDTTDVLAKQDQLVAALEALRAENNYAASYLMVTNILEEATTLLFAGDVNAVVSSAFGKDIENNGVYLPNVMSRKKQIAPPILGAMK